MNPQTYDNIFRPKAQPAQLIYDAFQHAAENRDFKTDWTHKERMAVFNAINDYAIDNNLNPVTIEMEDSIAYGLTHAHKHTEVFDFD